MQAAPRHAPQALLAHDPGRSPAAAGDAAGQSQLGLDARRAVGAAALGVDAPDHVEKDLVLHRVYAARLLEGPLPWTKMRQVYRLLGLVRRYGAARVDSACERALALDVVDVTKIARMLERALEGVPDGERATRPAGRVVQLRFARSAIEFALTKKEAST